MKRKKSVIRGDRNTYSYAIGKKWAARVNLDDMTSNVQYRPATAARWAKWRPAPIKSRDVYTAADALYLVSYWHSNPDKFDTGAGPEGQAA